MKKKLGLYRLSESHKMSLSKVGLFGYPLENGSRSKILVVLERSLIVLSKKLKRKTSLMFFFRENRQKKSPTCFSSHFGLFF